ncbi:carbohydrate-binding module family 21 protein [Phanerochaete carnosa HHB-10118-sp]|uniref:Carbohydrate-binding module family 21 protein n=1 Tax=Phanerochaete carnosa (strain HHB-10118-sp) TaxID=650164 RepID=K5WA25_PHACS|nr:carbohydrate-binding module family 21 protein [Phanerochaete carnosa HHB-10118-sp]EKM56070.1 carbohydrate-binding module family 21 protein [Phanerochaete carnosa HHB-10118-sp]
MGRKKSGEPLKSSLKSRRPIVRGDLSVVTGPLSSKSEPSTPTHIKSVHFDKQLEHVKLFLAEQKPAAVSRDGSPTDDTSGTESDFPAFIYGADEEKKGKLQMQVTGLREESEEERGRADVKLEKLELGEDGMSATGHIRVRNLTFEKWVAVRFTFDWWQTTSEVTARYVESLPDGACDRFQFTIRLNDMMSRIDEKTMLLAVRYSAAGREIWDNNCGENYKVTFSYQKVLRVQRKNAADDAGKAAGIADLKSKLEKVASGDEPRATVGGFLASRTSRTRSLSPSGPKSGKSEDDDDDESFTLKSNKPLSSRYDFSASLKSPWRRSPSNDSTPVPAGDRYRTITYPTTFPQFPRSTISADKRTFVALTRGSPRIFDGDDTDAQSNVRSYYADSDLEDTPVPAITRKPARNHQRGYFDLGVAPSASGVRRTPPGSPFGPLAGSPSGSGRNSPVGSESSIPAIATDAFEMPKIIGAQRMWRVPSGGSEDSTPSSNDDSSRSSSPDGSPYELPIALQPDSFAHSPSPGDKGSYDAFLNRFCFYTGSDSLLDVPSELHRSHSASSVEEFLSTSPYVGTDYRMATPTRSSSFDDVVTMSGSVTPTAQSVAAGIIASSPPQPMAAFAH